MQTKAILLVICLCWFSLLANAADPIRGNGKLTTQSQTLSDFNEIRINGPMAFHYEQTERDSPSLEVTIDENLYPHLHIEVKNRILTIEFKKVKVEQVTQFTVKAHSPWLKEARLSGNAALNIVQELTGDEIVLRGTANCLINCTGPVKAGKLELLLRQSANMVMNDIEAEEFKCDMDGSGSITIKNGKAAIGKYSITGSSDLHGYGMEIADLTCKITGSGLAEIYATDKLKANVIGSGHIRYKGIDPDNTTIIGKGAITKKEDK